MYPFATKFLHIKLKSGFHSRNGMVADIHVFSSM